MTDTFLSGDSLIKLLPGDLIAGVVRDIILLQTQFPVDLDLVDGEGFPRLYAEQFQENFVGETS